MKNGREEINRLNKKDVRNQNLIKKLHEDFKIMKKDIKKIGQLKEENLSL